ncbi:energy-coupling factor transporter transmembrane component T family protein [Paenibacillus bouchesdurhonensis]|uniref:energy-coupling factor transporter transmembrane component T family protein n=1 Tax=Paenibacillus bouchesdurhonensis TaxID=1870990 RepID=UPI000DA63056|nr:energy-coupling factor transporter transmembrane component T [Paenibacillus bouchesdurhonensis]
MRKFLTPKRETWLHRANPAAKLGIIVLLFLLTLFTHNLDFIVYQAIVIFLVLFLMSGHPPWKILLLILPLLFVFVSSSITMILFGKGDTLWWKWGIIRISEESFFRGIHIGFKSITFAAEGLLYVLTTSSVALFYALMQKVKLAPKYAYSFMASVRLLPMVWEEFQIRRNALQIRGVRHARGMRGWVEQTKQYAVPLLSQSIRRAHRVAVAMESKAFHNSRRRTYYYSSVFTLYDLGLLLVLILALAAAYNLSQLYPLFGITDIRY